jgi:hypothetical protein
LPSDLPTSQPSAVSPSLLPTRVPFLNVAPVCVV